MPQAQGEGLSESRFRWIAFGGTALLFVLLFWLRFSYDIPPPRAPAQPTDPRAVEVAQLNFSQGSFRAQLEEDSADYGVPRTTPEDLSDPLPHETIEVFNDISVGGAPLEIGPLRLTARQEPVTINTSRGTITGAHLILRIENKTDRHLAYHVDTAPSNVSRCATKGDLTQDAMALAPGGAAERTECVYRDGMTLTIERIETATLPPLSYYYVSRLYPPHVGLDARATRGHVPPKGKICNDIPEQTIRRGMQKGDVTWLDVIDFYARHDCGTYIFPPGYKAFTTRGQYQLPVSRESAGGAP